MTTSAGRCRHCRSGWAECVNKSETQKHEKIGRKNGSPSRIQPNMFLSSEKRLPRYPQLYSRVGFVHHFEALSSDEVRFILERKWQQLNRSLDMDDFTDAEAVGAIIRITGGNFRLLQRLLTQMQRIMDINDLSTVTKEVVEAARELLIIGT